MHDQAHRAGADRRPRDPHWRSEVLAMLSEAGPGPAIALEALLDRIERAGGDR